MDKIIQILDTPLASSKAEKFLNAIEGLMDVEASPATFQYVGKSLTAWLNGQPSDQVGITVFPLCAPLTFNVPSSENTESLRNSWPVCGIRHKRTMGEI